MSLPLELRIFDAFEDNACAIAHTLLEELDLDDFQKRLKEGRFIGVGTQRLLLHVCFRQLEGDVAKLVDFYGEARRPTDDPHYEDIATAMLIGAISGVAANAAWHILKKHAPAVRRETGHTLYLCGEQALATFRFLTDAAELRRKLWRREIDREQHEVKFERQYGEWRQELARLRATSNQQRKELAEESGSGTGRLSKRIAKLVQNALDANPELCERLQRILQEHDDERRPEHHA